MIQEFLDIQGNEELPELCAKLGHFLGLTVPVEKQVLLRAIDDPTYAMHLITCRNTPGFLNALLEDPKNKAYDLPASAPISVTVDPNTPDQTNLDLLKKATAAFFKWGKAGFSVIDEEGLKRREDACLACPNRSEPEKLIQKLTSTEEVGSAIGQRLGNSVCKLCGCTLNRKIKLPTESCPDKHPVLSGLTRWGEPI